MIFYYTCTWRMVIHAYSLEQQAKQVRPYYNYYICIRGKWQIGNACSLFCLMGRRLNSQVSHRGESLGTRLQVMTNISLKTKQMHKLVSTCISL